MRPALLQIVAGALDGLAVESKLLSHEGVTGVGYGVAEALLTARQNTGPAIYSANPVFFAYGEAVPCPHESELLRRPQTFYHESVQYFSKDGAAPTVCIGRGQM